MLGFLGCGKCTTPHVPERAKAVGIVLKECEEFRKCKGWRLRRLSRWCDRWNGPGGGVCAGSRPARMSPPRNFLRKKVIVWEL